jgi:cell division transport system permease protein
MRAFYVLRYFFNEAFTNLWSNRFNNFISVAIISFSLFTLGLFLLTAENLGQLIGHWTSNIKVNVFIDDTISPSDEAKLESLIKVSPFVAKYEFISKEEALKRFRSFYPAIGDLTEDLQGNPFPRSYEITVREEFQNQASVQQFVDQLRAEDFVQDVEYDQEWINRVQFMIRFIRSIGFIFGGILLFTATFSISNVIKLMVLSRKDEIEIMKLVGATNGFIKGPFLTEGLLHGFIGGSFAVLILYTTYVFIAAKVDSLNTPFFVSEYIHFLSPWMIALVIGGGMIVGFLGSLFSLSKLLRI